MKPKLFIVVSGLPASGKTTLAMKLGEALSLPVLDKDDILEALFQSHEDVDLGLRQRLSRMSDRVLEKIALRSPGAVLVSFWRHESEDGDSGTPISWINALPGKVLELHCACAPEVAERRFRERERHPAHNDVARHPGLGAQLQALAQRGPLGLGETITVRTDVSFEFSDVLDQVRDRGGRPD